MIPVFLGRAVRNRALRGLDDDLAQAIAGRGGAQAGERLVRCTEPLLKRAQALACLLAFSVSGERLKRRVGDGANDVVFEAALGPAEDFASLMRRAFASGPMNISLSAKPPNATPPSASASRSRAPICCRRRR